MAQVKFITSTNSDRRILNTSRKQPKLAASVIEAAFQARAVGSSDGLDLFALREALGKMLQSTGGRPSLVGAAREACRRIK